MASKHVSEDDSCYVCGNSNVNVLQSHHIIPRSFGGSDGEHNRVVLCANCHQTVHSIYSDSVFERLGGTKRPEADRKNGELLEFEKLPVASKFEYLSRHLPQSTIESELDHLYEFHLSEDDEENEYDGKPSVVEIVRRLQNVHDHEPGAPIEDVIGEIEEHYPDAEPRELIDSKRDKGELFSPSKDHLRSVL